MRAINCDDCRPSRVEVPISRLEVCAENVDVTVLTVRPHGDGFNMERYICSALFGVRVFRRFYPREGSVLANPSVVRATPLPSPSATALKPTPSARTGAEPPPLDRCWTQPTGSLDLPASTRITPPLRLGRNIPRRMPHRGRCQQSYQRRRSRDCRRIALLDDKSQGPAPSLPLLPTALGQLVAPLRSAHGRWGMR
jgi:hypothetical protein